MHRKSKPVAYELTWKSKVGDAVYWRTRGGQTLYGIVLEIDNGTVIVKDAAGAEHAVMAR